jgi:DNA ligase (NAD+)
MEEGFARLVQGTWKMPARQSLPISNREEFKEYVVSQGGKVSSAVSAKTSFLVNNDVESLSGKNQKAKKLGVPIISEDEFLRRFG